jgi:hypothetical protein
MLYDVFISHASEDKDGFVRLLAGQLKERRIEVWYDEFCLRPGDSLRQSIDQGLSKSRYGIVVLSRAFFQKQWTNWELDGLLSRQLHSTPGANMILPIWHGVTKEEIIHYSPSLADKVALTSSLPLTELVARIEAVLKPRGSTLLIARDFLLGYGIEPPVVTDDWWLDMVDYCGRSRFLHDYLSFHIPWVDETPEQRGINLGRYILQKRWQDNADDQWISQLTPPEEVLAFLSQNPGLPEACAAAPNQVAFYLPQLTIADHYASGQTALEVLFQGDAGKALELARLYFYGGTVWDFEPNTKRHEMIDCVLWLLSVKSDWLPGRVKQLLITGMKEWRCWPWDKITIGYPYTSKAYTLKFVSDLESIAQGRLKMVSPGGWQNLEDRFQRGIDLLHLPESVSTLKKAFLAHGFDQEYIQLYPLLAATRQSG